MASMISFTKSRGCEVVKRTRRMPSTSPTAPSSRAKSQPRRRGIAIAVHVLAQQLDFGVARRGQRARFVEDAFAGAAALRPPRERHHAIRAGFVAAFDDRDIRAMRVVAPRVGRVEGIVGIQAQPGDAPVAGFQLHQHLAAASYNWPSPPPALRAARARKSSRLPAAPRIPARRRLCPCRVALELLQPVKDLLLGLVADAAGVVENQLGFFGRLHPLVAFGQQRADDFFGVVRVHLAAEGLDVKRLHLSTIVTWLSVIVTWLRAHRLKDIHPPIFSGPFKVFVLIAAGRRSA